PTVSIAHAAVSVLAKPMVHSAESHMDDPLTAPVHGQLAHSQLAIISTGTSLCVGDGRWTGNPYVCRCLISSLCRYFGAHAKTWIGGI
nr:hypothetical protein [Tanacetum cinerariifolium]